MVDLSENIKVMLDYLWNALVGDNEPVNGLDLLKSLLHNATNFCLQESASCSIPWNILADLNQFRVIHSASHNTFFFQGSFIEKDCFSATISLAKQTDHLHMKHHKTHHKTKTTGAHLTKNINIFQYFYSKINSMGYLPVLSN